MLAVGHPFMASLNPVGKVRAMARHRPHRLADLCTVARHDNLHSTFTPSAPPLLHHKPRTRRALNDQPLSSVQDHFPWGTGLFQHIPIHYLASRVNLHLICCHVVQQPIKSQTPRPSARPLDLSRGRQERCGPRRLRFQNPRCRVASCYLHACRHDGAWWIDVTRDDSGILSCCRNHMLQKSHAAGTTCCRNHLLRKLHVAEIACCRNHMLQKLHVAEIACRGHYILQKSHVADITFCRNYMLSCCRNHMISCSRNHMISCSRTHMVSCYRDCILLCYRDQI